MSLWHSVRGEMAGAWRSVCYDLGRQPSAAPRPGPDVTSTGMNTFPGSPAGEPVGRAVAADATPPRRFVAVAAFCALAVCGAAGSYIVATTAFADRMTDPPVIAAAPLPPAAEDETEPPDSDAGMGAVPVTARGQRTSASLPRTPGATATTAPRATATKPSTDVRTRENTTRPGGGTVNGAPPAPGEPDCDCEMPPVPTPTAADPSPAPASPSVAAPTTAPPSPSASTSVEPSAGVTEPGGRSDRRHRRHQPG